MARPRSIAREGDKFVSICAACGKKRLLSSYPVRDICVSCSRRSRVKEPIQVFLSDQDVNSYLAGESATSIAVRLGIQAQTVINALRRQGAETRNMKEAVVLLDNTQRLKDQLDKLRASGEIGKLISAGHQKVSLKDWKDFRKHASERERGSNQWKAWRLAVFQRDGFCCVMCEDKGSKAGFLEPHHIKTKLKHPELMYEISNGVTLCRDCHRKTFWKEVQYEAEFTSYVQSLP